MESTDHPFVDGYLIGYPEGDTSVERDLFLFSGQNTIIHTVMEGETIQGIALRYYGDSGAWWRIGDFNAVLNPFVDLKQGLKLQIPVM